MAAGYLMGLRFSLKQIERGCFAFRQGACNNHRVGLNVSSIAGFEGFEDRLKQAALWGRERLPAHQSRIRKRVRNGVPLVLGDLKLSPELFLYLRGYIALWVHAISDRQFTDAGVVTVIRARGDLGIGIDQRGVSICLRNELRWCNMGLIFSASLCMNHIKSIDITKCEGR